MDYFRPKPQSPAIRTRPQSSADIARNRLQEVLKQKVLKKPDFIRQMKQLQQDLGDIISEFIEKYNRGDKIRSKQQSSASIAQTRLKLDQRRHPDFLQQLQGRLDTVIHKFITTDQNALGLGG